MDPVYGFQAVNVKAELLDPSSFLHWLQRMLRVRRQYPVFAQGDLEVLPANNPSISTDSPFTQSPKPSDNLTKHY